MVVSALPFPTKLLAEYVDEDRPERVAATIYGLNLLLTAMLLSLLWRYAVREGLIRTDIADDDVKVITRKLTPGLVGYVVMIMLGVFFPLLAVLGFYVDLETQQRIRSSAPIGLERQRARTRWCESRSLRT
jgi:uncharacterized membrane protein